MMASTQATSTPAVANLRKFREKDAHRKRPTAKASHSARISMPTKTNAFKQMATHTSRRFFSKQIKPSKIAAEKEGWPKAWIGSVPSEKPVNDQGIRLKRKMNRRP